MKSLIAGLGLLTVCGTAFAQASLPAAPHMSVSGTATRKVEPNRFTINLRVDVADARPIQARAKVEQRMAQVLAGFKAHHAVADSVDASAINIGPKTEYRNNETVVTGTRVWRTAKATFAKLDDLRGFIDGLDADEELQVAGMSVTRSDIDAIHQDLRRAAIEDSKRTAKSMADAYGVRLGTLYTVSDTPQGVSYMAAYSTAAPPAPPAPMAPIDLQVGSIEVKESVYATYLMEPQS
ncbi:SIMPL domain-containing protein [Bacillus sp. NP157]|nr:SIMPL domain-containing protein [Bacillus sp. NP157]